MRLATERLETARLVLRRPVVADAEAYVEFLSDPEAMRYIGDGSTGGLAAARLALERFDARWDVDGFGLFSVERREDGRVLGRVGLLVWNRDTWEHGTLAAFGEDAEVEIGWTLAREHWGRGYATEAAIACRDAAFGELGLRRLISLIHADNWRSIRVAEKLGERYERDVATWRGLTARLYAVER